MNRRAPRAIAFAGPSGSGKTTLIEKLLPVLGERGHSVGVVKHHGHPIELDTEGKDTWRLRRAGARTTALVGRDQVALFGSGAAHVSFSTLVEVFYGDCDLVLVEGFRTAGLPTIVVARAPLPDDWRRPRRPIALAVSPTDLELGPGDAWADALPRFALDDVVGLANEITRDSARYRVEPKGSDPGQPGGASGFSSGA